MSDKTFTETLGVAPFDWWKALENPTAHAHEDLCERAMMWTTCACGNQCAIIPRKIFPKDSHSNGIPIDEELKDFGFDFYRSVDSCRWEDAKEFLRIIEARSTILIAEELAKLRSEPVTTAGA